MYILMTILMVAISCLLYVGIHNKNAWAIILAMALNLALIAIWLRARKKKTENIINICSLTPFDHDRNEYDVFISYKSQNADTARYIADRLLSCNKTVWFAEYAILFKGRSDLEIKSAIEQGIRASKHAVIIINDKYALAEWCDFEIKNILKTIPSQNISVIDMPLENLPRMSYPALNGIQSHQYATDAEALQFVARSLLFKIDETEEREPTTTGNDFVYTGNCLNHKYSINLGSSWRLIGRGEETSSGDVKGVEFQYEAPCLVKMNIFAGPEYDPDARATRMKPDPSNRVMYNTLLQQAESHVAKIGARPRGVHLVFHSQCSQIAFTYWNKVCWTRKYSIILLHPESGDVAEFVLTFGVFSSFADFCRFVFIMDRAAKTLQWR